MRANGLANARAKRQVGALVAAQFALVVLLWLALAPSRSSSSSRVGTSWSRRLPDTRTWSLTNLWSTPPPDTMRLRARLGDRSAFLMRSGHGSLGYNNIRYIMESGLIMARLLNRVPIIPDFLWARACAVSWDLCAQNALEYWPHRNVQGKPYGMTWSDDGGAWKLPIEAFLDMENLRARYGMVLTVSEFFELHGRRSPVPANGHLDDDQVPSEFSVVHMTAAEFETAPLVRVDTLMPLGLADPRPTLFDEAFVRRSLGQRQTWTMQDARDRLCDSKRLDCSRLDDKDLDAALIRANVTRLYTFGQETKMHKAVVRPTVEYAYTSNVLPLDEDPRGGRQEDSFMFQREGIHDQRKPGSLRFTSEEARREFVDILVYAIQPPKIIDDVAEALARRMASMVEQRAWLSVHMRRGDFVLIGWSPEQSSREHLNKILTKLDDGVKVLGNRTTGPPPPRPNDPWFLATDEEDPEALAMFRSAGAVLMDDLLTDEDRDILGWRALFGDTLALVSQCLLARSTYFVGSDLSSTTGGVLNHRIRLGLPDWSWTTV